MKKLVLTCLSLIVGAGLVHAQGLVSITAGGGTVQTNGALLGGVSGNIRGLGNYDFELLDMTSTAWSALSSQGQAAAGNLFANGAYATNGVWSDSGLTGNSSSTAGAVSGSGGTGGTTAANWGAPTSSAYTSGSIDYYVIVGWSSNEGTTWAAVSQELASGNWNVLGAGAWFGETTVAYNYAGGGGGSPAASVVNLWGNSGGTGLAGSGESGTNPELVLTPVPEPTTLALAGLGGISMLFLRRRKA
jgi:hypothetical protein